MSEPIDAVITWVDGSDPIHKKKLDSYIAEKSLGVTPESTISTRFNQYGELDYCVSSILQYTPWIRTIFIVTDNQVPPIIKKIINTPYQERVKLIDHKDIFSGFEQYLPVFNSLAIETLLWRIPNLSNQFIYFNDDCFLIQPLKKSDFFYQDNMRIRGEWKTQTTRKWGFKIKHSLGKLFHADLKKDISNEHRIFQENSAKMVGFQRKFFNLPHFPFSLKKNTFENFFTENPALLISNIQFPFRHLEQFFPISLAYHLEIYNKTIIKDKKLKGIMVNGGIHSIDKIKKRLKLADKNKTCAFVCMQSLDLAPSYIREYLFYWLRQHIHLVAP